MLKKKCSPFFWNKIEQLKKRKKGEKCFFHIFFPEMFFEKLKKKSQCWNANPPLGNARVNYYLLLIIICRRLRW